MRFKNILLILLVLVSLQFVSAMELSDVTLTRDSTYALFELTTDDVAKVSLTISQNADLSGGRTIDESDYVTDHKILIGDLSPNQTYYYKFVVTDYLGHRTYDCSKSIYNDGDCNVGPNFGECLCGTGTSPDCGSGLTEGWFCANSLCREDLPAGFNADFTKCLARNFTTPFNDSLEPFLWLEVPEGIGQFQVTLDGYTEPGSQINVSLGGELVKIATPGVDGHFQIPVTLEEDSTTIDVLVQDDSGKTTSRTYNFVVDVMPPELKLTSTIPKLIGKNEFYISGTVSEDILVHYQVQQENDIKEDEIKVSAGTFNVTIPLYEGRNSVFVEYYDYAGLGQKITRTPSNPRKYVQDIISDTKAPIISENNLGDLSQTIVPYLAAVGKVEDLTETTVYIYGKVLDDSFVDVDYTGPTLNESETQISVHEQYSDYTLLAKGKIDSDGSFDVSFYLPADVESALSLSGDSDNLDLNADGSVSFFGAEVDLRLVAVDALGHYSEAQGNVKYGTCADNNDWVFEIDDDGIFPEKLDPYLIEQGLAELYIPFTVEYVGSDELMSGMRSPVFKMRQNVGAYNKQQFDWDAIKSCSVDFSESANEGYIVCKIKPYDVPSEKEASSAADEVAGEVEQTLEDAVNNYLDFRTLELPMTFKFGYETIDYNGDKSTQTYEQCVFLNVMVDVDLINESSERIQEVINFTLGIVDKLYNVTGEVDKVLDTALRVTILGSFGTTAAKIIAKTNELVKCSGLHADSESGTSFNWGLDGLLDGVLARPTAADVFNFRHGASDEYCEKVYSKKPDTSDEENPLLQSCIQCKEAVDGSESVKKIDYAVSDRVYCPDVPTYQEFVRQRYLSLRQAQSPYIDSSDVLVYVSQDAKDSALGTYGKKKIVKTDKSMKDMPLDLACENYIISAVNSNDEMAKMGLFPDIKKDGDKYVADDTKEEDAKSSACVKAYKDEYDSACWASYVENNYIASRDYQIEVLNEIAMKEDTTFTSGAVKFITSLGDLSSTISKMCTMESLNNSVYKQIVEDDRELFDKIPQQNGFKKTFDQMLAAIRNDEASYGFLVKGSQVYFIEASSEAEVVVTGDGNSGEIARTGLEFDLTNCNGGSVPGERACMRLYINKQGCAFTKRLPDSTDAGDSNLNSNPNFYYPNDDRTACVTGEGNPVAIGTEGYIGVLPTRVYDKIIFEGGKKVLREPTNGFFNSVGCGCLSGARANVQRWHTYLGYIKNCLESAQGAGGIEDTQCYEMFAEQLCDSLYALVSCATGQSGTSGLSMDFGGGRGQTGAVSAFFQATSTSTRESTERYGASFTTVTDLTTKYIVNSACYGFLGLPLPDDLSLWGALGMLSDQATDQIVLEPIATFMRARGSFYGVNKNLGYSRINYQIIPHILATTDNTRVRVELVCSSDYSCSQLSTDGKCDCYGYGTDQIMTFPSGTTILDKNENMNDLLVQTIERPYRYDSIRMIVEYKDSDGVMQTLETDKFPIDFNNGTAPSTCSYDESYIDATYGGRGGYVCERFSTTGSTFAFVGEPNLKYSTVYAQKSQSDSTDPDENNKIILENLKFYIQDGNIQYNDNVEDYEYDPLAEAQSDTNGYSESKFAKYYRVRLFNEQNSMLYDSGAQIIPVGEHSYSDTEPRRAGTGEYGFNPTLSDLIGGSDNLGTLSIRKLDSSTGLTLDDRELLKSSPSSYSMIVNFSDVGGAYSLSYYMTPSEKVDNACEPGKTPIGSYCINDNDKVDITEAPTITTLSGSKKRLVYNDVNGIRITFVDSDTSSASTSTVYYILEYEPQSVFESAATSNLCDPVTYTVILTIHDAQADGLPSSIVATDSSGQELRRDFTATVSCYKEEASSSSSPTTTCKTMKGTCVERGTYTPSVACDVAGYDNSEGQFDCSNTQVCCTNDDKTCTGNNGECISSALCSNDDTISGMTGCNSGEVCCKK